MNGHWAEKTIEKAVQQGYVDGYGDAVFDFFQIQITNEANTVMILDSGKLWQRTTATTGSWFVTQDLPAGQKLRVRVKVWDQYGAESEWSPQAWMYINRPPAGSITFVLPIYEHDTPTFTVNVSDPDGDAIDILVHSNYNWEAFTLIQQWSGVPSGQSKAFTYGPLPKGNYEMRLTLNDGKGGTFEQIYSFVVLPLTITGYVNHAPSWESYRLAWNAKHGNEQRAADVFWAGEAFDLSASVTDTGTSTTKAQAVDAALMETGEQIALQDAGNKIRFIGNY